MSAINVESMEDHIRKIVDESNWVGEKRIESEVANGDSLSAFGSIVGISNANPVAPAFQR